jgi:hypothetical protein
MTQTREPAIFRMEGTWEAGFLASDIRNYLKSMVIWKQPIALENILQFIYSI